MSRHLRTFLTWLAVYPLITFLAWALQPLFKICALPLQTLILSALMVPLIAYGIVPLVNRMGPRLRSKPVPPLTSSQQKT
ncbi:MAG: hypothetical protein ACFB20_04240 [Opitutales bacterium]